jgi:hypothetical protein
MNSRGKYSIYFSCYKLWCECCGPPKKKQKKQFWKVYRRRDKIEVRKRLLDE